MKKLILMFGGIILGVFIWGLLTDDNNPNSLKNTSKVVWQQQIEQQKIIP